MEGYFFGNYASNTGRFRFFYRTSEDNPATPKDDRHGSIKWLESQGYTGSILNTGFTPYLDGQQQDYSMIGGLRGQLPAGFSYDVSAAIGGNELEHYLHNAISYNVLPTEDEVGERSFYIGLFRQQELNLNADFTKQLSDRLPSLGR